MRKYVHLIYVYMKRNVFAHLRTNNYKNDENGIRNKTSTSRQRNFNYVPQFITNGFVSITWTIWEM